MATLTSLPDELVSRIFRFVREQAEHELLLRILDEADMDGAVAMPAHSALHGLPLISRRFRKLGLEALNYSQHVWDPQTMQATGQIANRAESSPWIRSLRIDHGELLSGYPMDAASLLESWYGMLEPLMPFLSSRNHLRYLHIALPRDDTLPSDVVVMPVFRRAFIPSTGLHSLSLKGGGPVAALLTLKTALHIPSIFRVGTLRLESLTSRDFDSLPEIREPFVEVDHLFMFDVLTHETWNSPLDLGFRSFVNMFRRYPTRLTIRTTYFKKLEHLEQLFGSFGQQLEHVDLSLHNLERRSEGFTIYPLHNDFACDSEEDMPASITFLKHCKQLKYLRLRSVHLYYIRYLDLPAVDTLSIDWLFNGRGEEDLLHYLRSGPPIRCLELNLAVHPQTEERYNMLRESRTGTGETLRECLQICEQRSIVVLPSDVWVRWTQEFRPYFAPSSDSEMCVA